MGGGGSFKIGGSGNKMFILHTHGLHVPYMYCIPWSTNTHSIGDYHNHYHTGAT